MSETQLRPLIPLAFCTTEQHAAGETGITETPSPRYGAFGESRVSQSEIHDLVRKGVVMPRGSFLEGGRTSHKKETVTSRFRVDAATPLACCVAAVRLHPPAPLVALALVLKPFVDRQEVLQ
jgi:hypothetical protein